MSKNKKETIEEQEHESEEFKDPIESYDEQPEPPAKENTKE